MALNIDTIRFLASNISQSQPKLFSSATKQLFSYLSEEVKDNPIYDHYENELKTWISWPNSDPWYLPNTIEETKSLSYFLYKKIAVHNNNETINIALSLFRIANYKELLDKFNQTFLGYFEIALEDIIRANPELDNSAPKVISSKTVFIIHGHDNDIKREVQLLLNRAGINSIVLHEQPDRGRTIIDKLTQETSQAGYAIALLTPDDITDGGTTRARQNVILEIGYLLGSIGKERVRMLVKGNVEIPSDLHGVLYEKHDENGAWKMRLLKEIQAVGIYVDMNSVVSQL